MPRKRKDKSRLNEVFATVAKGLAHANRIELLELLAQGERDVDSLAQGSYMSVANTSHHLRFLRQCGLIRSRQQGQRVIYRLSDDRVIALITLLHAVAVQNLPELDRLLADHFPADTPGQSISPDELTTLIQSDAPRIFDLRHSAEYAAAHIPGAENISIKELKEAPPVTGSPVCVVYCRGTFCISPYAASRILTDKGYAVKRLEGGFPAWRIRKSPHVSDTSSNSGTAD